MIINEKYVRNFLIGTAASLLFFSAVFYFLFQYQNRVIAGQYKEFITNAAATMLGSEAEAKEFLSGHGYYDPAYLAHFKEDKDTKRIYVYFEAILVFCILFSCFLGSFYMKKIYGDIRKNTHTLSQILNITKLSKKEQQKKVFAFSNLEELRHALTGRYKEGAIGELQAQIWDTALVCREKLDAEKKEQYYLKKMMTDISHQFKTPLASLQIFLDIFEKEINRMGTSPTDMDKIPSNANSRYSLSTLATQAKLQLERMRWLVTGILQLARIESGTLPMPRKKSPLIHTLKQSIAAVQALLRQKSLRIDLDMDEDIILEHNADWLCEALTNLLKNAAEYAPEGSSIKLSGSWTPIAVTIQVEDRGRGIPSSELPKIFNRFYRVKHRPQSDGVGIGLALCKSIIEAQGGTILAESVTGEGSYTRFIINFLTK